jgi:hypothetical protein
MPKRIVFRTGYAAWIVVATFLPSVIGIVLLFTDPWFIGLLFLPVIIITFSIFFRTSYTIHDINQLTVVCGILYKKTFNVNDVESLRPSSNVISSPALSLKRLELKFKNKQTLLISPAQKEKFTEALLSINPGIVVKNK